MLPRSVEIGPLTIHFYGLIIAIAIYLGWYLAKRRAHIYKIPQKIFDDPILLIPLALAIIGARLYHVIDLWSVYRANLISVFYIASGGLGIWGALVGVFIGFLIVAKKRKLNFLNALDLAAPSILLGQAIGRFGNFINQEGFGPPANSPWAVFIEKQYRPPQYLSSTHFHPTFFYEAILNLIFFTVLLKLSERSKVRGQVFALYLIFYSTTRFLVEFWRIDTWVIGGLKVAHLISVGSLIIGFWIFAKSSNKKINP